MSLIRKHVAVLQAWACLDLVFANVLAQNVSAKWDCVTVVVCADGEHSDVLDILRELRSAEDQSVPDRRSVRRNQHATVSVSCTVPWNRGLNSVSILFFQHMPTNKK